MPRRDLRKTIAIKAAEDSRALWRFHVKQCATCTGAVRDERPMRICDEGWPLASNEARTRVALDQYREALRNAPAVDQPALF
jgi:hypothetical protein